MKAEEKQLLLKDLSARLPYGVKVLSPWKKDGPCKLSEIDLTSSRQIRVFEDWFRVEDVRPYLRPMSSMTEEEKYTYRHMLGATLNSEGESIMFVYVEDFSVVIDWLNARHFDYRGLIEKGLALEAPEWMYKKD